MSAKEPLVVPTKKPRKRFWLSFDLGLRGPYEELYEWLDKMEASECVGNLATFTSEKSHDQLIRALKRCVGKQQSKHIRLYLINLERGGKFILGRRKAPAWMGSDANKVAEEDER